MSILYIYFAVVETFVHVVVTTKKQTVDSGSIKRSQRNLNQTCFFLQFILQMNLDEMMNR